MDFKKGTFTAATGTGNQTVTGVGFTPKALIIWTNYLTATGFSDGQGALYQIGMADGTRQNSMYGRNDDNTSPNDCDRDDSQTIICSINNVAGTLQRAGSLSSFGSGQFVINWTTVDAVAAIFHYIALGGSDLNAHCDNMTCSSPGFSLSATPAFIPTVGIFVQAASAGDACNFPNIGWYVIRNDSTIQQGSLATNVEDNQATSDTWRYQRTNRCSSILTAATGVLFNDFAKNHVTLSLESFTASASIFLHTLLLGGIRGFATSFLQRTSTGTTAITGSGFTPKGVIFGTVGQTAQTTVQTESKASIGAGDGSTQGYAWVGTLDAANPSVAVGNHDTSNVIVCATPNATAGSSTKEAEASLQSLDSDGFTVNWGTADATQREIIALALGDPAAGGGGSGVFSAAYIG